MAKGINLNGEKKEDHIKDEMAEYQLNQEEKRKLIKMMFNKGVKKKKIHELTGIARTTIDRALKIEGIKRKEIKVFS